MKTEKFIQPNVETELKTTDKDSLWLAQTVAKMQTEQAVDKDQILKIIWSKTITELKEIITGAPWIEDASGENLETKIDVAHKMFKIASEILPKNKMDEIIKISNSNKFRPLNYEEVNEGEIFNEKNKFIEKSKTVELGEREAKEIASYKKIARMLIDRLFEEDGAQNIADLDGLVANHPALAADLGKIFQAVEIIKLHEQRLVRIEQKRQERKTRINELKGKARQRALEPIVHLRSLIDTIDLGDASRKFKFFPNGSEDQKSAEGDLRYYFPDEKSGEWKAKDKTIN